MEAITHHPAHHEMFIEHFTGGGLSENPDWECVGCPGDGEEGARLLPGWVEECPYCGYMSPNIEYPPYESGSDDDDDEAVARVHLRILPEHRAYHERKGKGKGTGGRE